MKDDIDDPISLEQPTPNHSIDRPVPQENPKDSYFAALVSI